MAPLKSQGRDFARYETSAPSAPDLLIRKAARPKAAGPWSSTNGLAIDARHRKGLNLPTPVEHAMLASKNKHGAAPAGSSARQKSLSERTVSGG